MAAEQTATGEITRRSVIQLTGTVLALPVVNFDASHVENALMPFTPKFVDLVRNFATVQGNGKVTLGAPVHGYTGIAAALQAGDQFYYSLQGVDKPHEREIGRGTLEANGKVAREAVNGSLTPFSSGTKTIALVAAAEWFDKLESVGVAGASIEAASRANLADAQPSRGPAMLTETGREGLFVWDPSDLTAMVSADIAQGLFVAPAADATGASGAWVRKFSGELNAQWFGVLPTNSAAANVTALNAALAAVKSLAVSGGYSKGGLELFFPPSNVPYDFNATIDLRQGIRLRSTGTKFSAGAKLRWTATVTGFRCQSATTSGASGTGASLDGAAGVTLEGLWLIGNYDGTSVVADAEAHGFHARSQFLLRDCMIQYWAGDGIHVVADVSSASGNANSSQISNIWVETVRNGLYCQGGDANVIEVNGLSVVGARQYGVYDQSFLGNTYTNLHVATCGREPGTAARPASLVQYSSKVYQLIPGQEAWAAANAPSGTTADNQGWIYIDFANTTGLPVWNGSLVLRSGGGGGFYIGGANQTAALVNPYVEGDSGYGFVGPLTAVFNKGQTNILSHAGTAVSRNVPAIRAASGQLYVDGYLFAFNSLGTREALHGKRLELNHYDASGALAGLGGFIDTHPDLYPRYFARSGAFHSFQIANGPEVMTVATSGVQVVFGRLSFGAQATLTNAVDDSAAATAGVPVGGVYRNGSALMVRVA